MPKVSISGSSCRQFIGEQTEFEVEATSFRRLIRELDSRFPGLGEHIDETMAIAIDGEIHQDAYGLQLPADSEIFLIPKIGGG
jgi:molybdopterin converting factor small subunit